VPVQIPHDKVIHEQQGSCADDASRDAVVVADDRVLDRVRQCQQHDQVERVQLCELTLAGETKTRDQKQVDDNRPSDLFGNRQAEKEHVVEHLGSHGGYYALRAIW
jgi:hypothetical protein